MQSLLQDPSAAGEAVQFSQFFLSTSILWTRRPVQQYIQEPRKNCDMEYFRNRAIITTRKVSLQSLSEIVENNFPEEAIPYASSDNVKSDGSAVVGIQFPVEMLITLTAGSASPDLLLSFKVGFPVVLSRYRELHQNHVNEKHYLVNASHPYFLFLKFLTADIEEKLFSLPETPCGPGDSKLASQGFTRSQCPV